MRHVRQLYNVNNFISICLQLENLLLDLFVFITKYRKRFSNE